MSEAPDLQTGFSRDYVAFMRCDAGEGWLPEVESQLASWLRWKGLDIAVDRDDDLEAGGYVATMRRTAHDGARDLRFSMRETNRSGAFVTELVAHDEDGADDWVSLVVRSLSGKFVEVPRLAKHLMEVLPLGDGAVRFTAQPQLLRTEDVDWLADVLADEARHTLVFVAGTDAKSGIPVDAFVAKVGEWAKRVFGLGQVIVLDPAATEEFSRRVGVRFAAHPWTIRTFRPGARYDNDLDSRRHRFLSTRSLADQSDGRISYLLGDVARNHAAARAEPASVRRVRHRFERLENRKLVDALALEPTQPEPVERKSVEPEPGPRPEPVGPPGLVGHLREEVAQVGLVKTILGLVEVTEASLRDIASRLTNAATARRTAGELQVRLDTLQERVEELEMERDDVEASLRAEELDHEVAEIELDEAQERVAWLTARLRERGDHEAAYAEVPSEFRTDRPNDFEELVRRIDDVPGVVFTGDADVVARLSVIDTNETALRTAWDAVLVLAGYARARGCGDWDHSLKKWIHETPSGYDTFPPGKFAETETGTTMKAFGRERVFPVPRDVDDAGEIEMKAHFKLARIGTKSPRMHVYDAHPHRPVVCIGYIGSHLTNTHT